ncbi:MAG: hypothetical protein JW720_11475 [Sedimentisphaerales bacterium]|nr:hypothetical protein [Sedimentisphaerales bacterium]
MADIKSKYAAAASITISLASLADDAKRQSGAIDNSGNLYLDAHVQLKVKTGASVGGDKAVYVYAYGSTDSGALGYSGGASGSDSAFSGTLANTRLIGVISTPAAATAYESDLMSVAAAFGGSLPGKWGVIVENKSGSALDTTEANHVKKFVGIAAQSS